MSGLRSSVSPPPMIQLFGESCETDPIKVLKGWRNFTKAIANPDQEEECTYDNDHKLLIEERLDQIKRLKNHPATRSPTFIALKIRQTSTCQTSLISATSWSTTRVAPAHHVFRHGSRGLAGFHKEPGATSAPCRHTATALSHPCPYSGKCTRRTVTPSPTSSRGSST